MSQKPPSLYTGNIKAYFELVFGYVKGIAEKIMRSPEHKPRFEQALLSALEGTQPPLGAGVRQDPIDLFVGDKLFRPFAEIADTYESLCNISVYVSSFPFRTESVSRVGYLRYHIENYLNELYILKERLVSFTITIDRAYKTSPEYPHIFKITSLLRSLVEKPLQQYVKTRGSHIHQYRYSDDDVARLSTLDLLTKGNDASFTEAIQPIFADAYRQARKKWRQKIISDLSEVKRLLDSYFLGVLKIVNVKDALLLPASLRKRKPQVL
jgi:hypothetical protein